MNFVWSMLSGIGSLLSRNKSEDFTEEDYNKVLFSETKENVSTFFSFIMVLGIVQKISP